MLIFFSQKRSKLSFDESNEEEMLDLLAAAPACRIAVAGHSLVTEDARVGPSELMDSGARGDSSAVEAPEKGRNALLGPIGREGEIPEEHVFQSKSSPKRKL